MEENELRIGNLVCPIQRNTEIHMPSTLYVMEVAVIDPPAIWCSRNGVRTKYITWDLAGIPLTPEWLEKFGFAHNGIPTGYTIGNRIQVRHCYKSVIKGTRQWNVELYDGDNWITASRPQYVHQLQNMCYALTGEELEIKETA